jgi:Spy/CpxP family protein refolding chaperone
VRRLRPLLLLAALLALPAFPALGQGAAEGKWWKRPRVARQLNLSAGQVAELEKIFARSKPKLIDLRADFEKKQFDYDQAMQSDDSSREALEAKIEAREQARAALQKELALMELDMKKVLNPEQREKLVEMREKARALVQERRRRMRDSAFDGGETDVAPSDRAPAETEKRVTTPKRDR